MSTALELFVAASTIAALDVGSEVTLVLFVEVIFLAMLVMFDTVAPLLPNQTRKKEKLILFTCL